MNIWWLLAMPAWLVVAAAAVACLNDIEPKPFRRRWLQRRIGPSALFVSAVVVLTRPFTLSAFYTPEPTWISAIIAWGVAVTWLTTPHMPVRRLLHGPAADAPASPETMAGRITGRFKAIRDGWSAPGGDRRSGVDRRSGEDRRGGDGGRRRNGR